MIKYNMKLKTKSAVKKRFKLTANGKIKCGAINKRHGLSKKPNKRKKLNTGTCVFGKVQANMVKKHLISGKL
jgi:large subunit ribosomal protein L35